MADRVPTGRPAPWRFDRLACRADLDAFADLLAAQAELSERDAILPFFREHPHLAALLGSFNPNVVSYDRLGFEVGLFGQFAADVVVGDAEGRAYCFVEFEDGRRNSIFVQQGRQTPEWASRFEHALGQIIDWLWLLDDQEQTLAFEERFGPRPVAVTALLVAGRDSGVSALGRRRLAWREQHILVNSQHIYCNTYDDLLRILRRRLTASQGLWLVPPSPPSP